MIRLLSIFFVAAAFVFTVGSAKAQTFSWQATAGQPSTNVSTDSISSIVINGSGYIYVGVVRNDGQNVGDALGVYRSTDGGATWDSLPNPVNDQGGTIPLGPVYACSPKGYVYMGGGKGLYRGNEDGSGIVADTIIEGVNPTVTAIAFAPNGNLFLTSDEYGLCTADEMGANWNENVGIAGIPDGDNPEYAACSPQGVVFVVTADAVARSSDNGVHWTKVGQSFSGFGIGASFAFDVLGNIVGGGDNGLFRSTDNGNSWTSLALPASGNSNYVLAIAANEDVFISPNDFFGDESGVYVSSDGGGSWNTNNNGLASTYVEGFAINSAGYVFAATSSGVYETTTSSGAFSDVKSIADDLPSAITLEQNHPNPVNSTTTIRFAIPDPATVSMKVYDVTGNPVEDLADGFYTPGTYDVSFDASRLPSGMYIYRMESNGQSLSRTFLVLP